MNKDAMLEIDSLRKTFAGVDSAQPVLGGVSLRIERGESVALTGESGSGKSTLLTLIAGLDRPDAGAIRLDGDDITGWRDSRLADMRRARIGLVFQQFNLIPSLSAGQNLAFQARLAGRADADRIARITRTLGLDDVDRRYPETLSGGQQQRVAIGRTLAARPDLVLADEPTGNLDEATGDTVLDLMRALCAETGAALLMVTHSTRLAARLDRRLNLSQGRLT